MPQNRILVAGDTNRTLAVKLIDAQGNPFDLTGCTINLLYTISGGEQQERSMTQDTSDPTVLNRALYNWQADDLTPGFLIGEVFFINTLGKSLTTDDHFTYMVRSR